MDASSKHKNLETKQEDIELLPTTSVIDPKEMACTNPVEDKESPVIALNTITVEQESKVEEIYSLPMTKPGEISKPDEDEEIILIQSPNVTKGDQECRVKEQVSLPPIKAVIAQATNINEVDQESQVKDEVSLPHTRVPAAEGIECNKPAEDEEIDLIVQAPTSKEFIQESQVNEEELLSTTTPIDSEGLKSHTSTEDEKKAFIADSIIEMGNTETHSEEDGADDSCSCCGCCK